MPLTHLSRLVVLAPGALGLLLCACSRSKTPSEIPPPVSSDSAISVSDLLEPQRQLSYGIPNCPAGVKFVESQVDGNQLSGVIGQHSAVIDLEPANANWDLSQYNVVRLDVTNNGDSLVWIEGRLDNADAQDWQNSVPSQLHLMPGESGSLGIAMYRDDKSYAGPGVFSKMRTKPNGHRQHWRKFDPAKVEKLRLVVRSPDQTFDLSGLWLSAAYPYHPEPDAQAFSLPYLDKYGQARVFDWPGKVHSDLDFKHDAGGDTETVGTQSVIAAEVEEESAALPIADGSVEPLKTGSEIEFDQYGGWANGPKRKATGWFRTEKYKNKWWLVTPEGNLFWSNGINGVARPVLSQVTWREKLHEWLPDPADPEFGSCFVEKEKKQFFDFRSANLIRQYGAEWRKLSSTKAKDRLKQWGINTAGAWSSKDLIQLGETPYAPLIYLWFPKTTCIGKTPDPFHPDFRKRLSAAVERFSSASKPNEWCIGVFVGNEIDWPKNLVVQVLRSPADTPAKTAFIGELKEKYGAVERLNQAWETKYSSWKALNSDQAISWSASREDDFQDLYEFYADEFYSRCASQLHQQLPNHLYLGSRVHVCPPVVAKAATKHVDVFSLNYYTPVAGVGSVPEDADIPIMITEYHFGAIDRGVPGAGLMGVLDQRERGRAFVGYVLSALQDPRIVGAHWFSYSDQSAAGHPAPNNQIGFVDVLDQPYDALTDDAAALGKQLYCYRSQNRRFIESLQEILTD